MPVLFSWYAIDLTARLCIMKTNHRFLSLSTFVLALIILPMVTHASDTNRVLYKCTDQSGVALYTNQKTKNKSCTVISVQMVPPPSNKGATNGVVPGSTGGTKTPTPTDFPRVSNNDQKARDGDRRAILDRELAAEQANLEKAKIPTSASTASPEARKAWQDSIALHERNIEALNKEIAGLR